VRSHCALSHYAVSLCYLSLWSLDVLPYRVIRLSAAEMINKAAYEKVEVALRPYELAPFVPGVPYAMRCLSCAVCVLLCVM
jgi:hypothetical protein